MLPATDSGCIQVIISSSTCEFSWEMAAIGPAPYLKFKALLQKEIKIIAVCPFIIPSPAGILH